MTRPPFYIIMFPCVIFTRATGPKLTMASKLPFVVGLFYCPMCYVHQMDVHLRMVIWIGPLPYLKHRLVPVYIPECVPPGNLGG
eukprot:6749923-Karenia_brevis.AAC.1